MSWWSSAVALSPRKPSGAAGEVTLIPLTSDMCRSASLSLSAVKAEQGRCSILLVTRGIAATPGAWRHPRAHSSKMGGHRVVHYMGSRVEPGSTDKKASRALLDFALEFDPNLADTLRQETEVTTYAVEDHEGRPGGVIESHSDIITNC